MCRGSVHAFQTSSRGASNTRQMAKSRSADGSVGLISFAAMMFSFLLGFSLCLQFMQIVVQTIKTLLPKTPVAFEPVHRLLERSGLEPAGAPLRLPSARDQPAALQHLEMFGDGGKTHVERLRQLLDRNRAGGEAGENGPPGGIGQGRERGAEMIGQHSL